MSELEKAVNGAWSPREEIQLHLDTALDQLDFHEAIDWPAEPPTDIEQLWLLRSMCVRYGRALDEVRRWFETAIAHHLGEGGTARVGDEFIRYAKNPKTEVDTKALEDWMRDNLTVDDVIAIAPKLSKIRKTGLRNVAKRLGLSVDAVEGSFMTTRLEDPKLSAMPVDNENTPQYAAHMRSGEIRRKT